MMSFQNMFKTKRKKKYSSLLDPCDTSKHEREDNEEHSTQEESEDQSRYGHDVDNGSMTNLPDIDDLVTETPPPHTEDQKENKKKKSFFKTVKNIILLKKFRGSSKRRKRKHSIYDELDEDFGEMDEAEYEVVIVREGEEEGGERYESIEKVMGNGKKFRVNKAPKNRTSAERKSRGDDKNKRVRFKPKDTRFKKRKSTKKKVWKATKSTGKFIGRGVIYTGSAFQYLAPVTSPPPERTWKKWHERPSPVYKQSEFVFV